MYNLSHLQLLCISIACLPFLHVELQDPISLTQQPLGTSLVGHQSGGPLQHFGPANLENNLFCYGIQITLELLQNCRFSTPFLAIGLGQLFGSFPVFFFFFFLMVFLSSVMTFLGCLLGVSHPLLLCSLKWRKKYQILNISHYAVQTPHQAPNSKKK
jgi:hypothetical protein